MTQPIEPLTLDEAKTAMREVVAERGEDFRYVKKTDSFRTVCMYAPTGHPAIADEITRGSFAAVYIPPAAQVTGCIVGEVLKRTGRLTDQIASARMNARSLVEEGLLSATDEAKAFLNAAQLEQDNAATWGEAERAAIAAVL